MKLNPLKSNIDIVFRPEMYGITPHFTRALGMDRVYRFDKKKNSMEFITIVPKGQPLVAVTEEQFKNWSKSIMISIDGTFL